MSEWWTDAGEEEGKRLLARENANGVPIERFQGTRIQVLDQWGDSWVGLFHIQEPGLYCIMLDDLDFIKSHDILRLHDKSLVDFRWPPSGLAHDYYQHARDVQLRSVG